MAPSFDRNMGPSVRTASPQLAEGVCNRLIYSTGGVKHEILSS